jgi:hypothetical protein
VAAPIIVNGEIISPYIIVLITLIFFIVFWCWIAYLLSSEPATGQLLIACVAGQCGTNIYNGEKRCPANDEDVVLIDPSYEVCNSKYVCENSRTPFAVQSDGSTNNSGICEPDTICRCLSYATCSSQSTVLFNTVNGSLYSADPSSRFSLQQIAVNGDFGSSQVTFESTSASFCSIKTNYLNRLSPGSCTFSDSDYNNINGTVYVATACINTNPCIKGVMAFNTSTPSQFEINGVGLNEVRTFPVTCVNTHISCDTLGTECPDNQCPAGLVPYWDERWGLVRCATILF